jgi:hypothetical protein
MGPPRFDNVTQPYATGAVTSTGLACYHFHWNDTNQDGAVVRKRQANIA